jgi:hypothetical protein
MRHTLSIFCCGMVLTLGASPGEAQDSILARPDFKALAATLNKSVNRTSSLEVFGESVREQLLNSAARDVAKGSLTSKVNLTFTVRVIRRPPLPPRVPSPTEINVCWEMCSSLRCYIECEAPIPELGP